MSTHSLLAVVLALAAALSFAVATVGQQRAAARSSDEEARGSRFLGRLLRDPRWLLATLGNGVGYALQAAALGVGSVVVVQPILVTSLLFALPLSAHLGNHRLSWTTIGSGVVLSVSLSVFVLLGAAGRGVGRGSYQDWLIVAAIGVPLVAGFLIAARPRSGSTRAALIAIAVGFLGGVLAVLTKSVVDASAGGVTALLTSGELYGLIVVGLAGTYLQQLSFQAGELQASLPTMTVLEPVIAAALGVTLLHEQLALGGLRATLLVVAVLSMAVTTVALARGQARALAA